jgi:NAD+ diphosphatase
MADGRIPGGDRFVPGLSGPVDATSPAWWFAFHRAQLVVHRDEAGARVPLVRSADEIGLPTEPPVYLGRLGEVPVYAAVVPEEAEVPEELDAVGLRGLFGVLDDATFALAGRAFQLAEWDRTHRYCGVCGADTVPAGDERARVCRRCGHPHFPRVSPAIIVRVDRGGGEEILLAHAAGFADGMYSVLAGFVEPGESLEEAVAREIMEEVGVEVAGVRYFGSQPWPFPHSLMVGFTAAHVAGDIAVDGREIDDAGWFGRDALPHIPPKLSIARWLIEDWLAATT